MCSRFYTVIWPSNNGNNFRYEGLYFFPKGWAIPHPLPETGGHVTPLRQAIHQLRTEFSAQAFLPKLAQSKRPPELLFHPLASHGQYCSSTCTAIHELTPASILGKTASSVQCPLSQQEIPQLMAPPAPIRALDSFQQVHPQVHPQVHLNWSAPPAPSAPTSAPTSALTSAPANSASSNAAFSAMTVMFALMVISFNAQWTYKLIQTVLSNPPAHGLCSQSRILQSANWHNWIHTYQYLSNDL